MPHDPYYASRPWRALRAACLDAANHRCATPRCGARATVADHITPRRLGGPDAPRNLQALCAACHRRKTNRTDGGFGRPSSRRRAFGRDGWPEGEGGQKV